MYNINLIFNLNTFNYIKTTYNNLNMFNYIRKTYNNLSKYLVPFQKYEIYQNIENFFNKVQ